MHGPKLGKSIAGTIIALLYGCSSVCAATVSGPSGAVLVNQGSGFVPLTKDAEVAPGGQVMVKSGSVAMITYGSNCSIKVGSGRVWTIQEASPCTNGAGEIDLTNRMNQDGGGGGGAGTALLVGGVAIGGGLLIGCLVSWCKSDKSSP